MTSINVSIMIVGGVVALAAARQQQSIPESASGGFIRAAAADNRTRVLGPQSCANLVVLCTTRS